MKTLSSLGRDSETAEPTVARQDFLVFHATTLDNHCFPSSSVDHVDGWIEAATLRRWNSWRLHPPGHAEPFLRRDSPNRMMTLNGFCEQLGLISGFVLVAMVAVLKQLA
jgi:hypothetical protein